MAPARGLRREQATNNAQRAGGAVGAGVRNVMQFPGDAKTFGSSPPAGASGATQKIGFIDGSISPSEIAALASLFPNVTFESVGSAWPHRPAPGMIILLAGANAASV